MLSSTNGISVDLHGKADTHLSLKGKGVINGATGRFTFLSNSTQVQFGVLKHFAGNISFTVKGFDPVLDTLTADR
ncbi:MAG: hypothetical protein KDA68_21855, partial [Planctomycetaceae bacterium]|nr:hypothetical protein [Planctomycetaceae bacterium]